MKRKSILIVDDEEKNIKLLKGMLASENYHLPDARNGEEALAIVAHTSPDLILLDVMMPGGIDGFDVCRRLNENKETRVIPVVMVTALKEKEHRVKAMQVGADDFLSKPVDRTELVVRVKSLLRIKSYHDELSDSYREITEKNQKLKELEGIKEELTHMIVHDLRNPLTGISMNLESMLMNKENMSEGQIRAITRSQNHCLDLDLLIESLLNMNKMEEGKMELSKEMTNMAVLKDEVSAQFAQRIKSKNISFSFYHNRDVPYVFVDRGLIKRVIANLMSNAIRHTPVKGIIEGDVDFLPQEDSVSVSVRDHGDGIETRYHERIFNKFEQTELKQAGIKTGVSGLGLAFCKMAVEAHEGKIWVESEGQGKGSAFFFTVPVTERG